MKRLPEQLLWDRLKKRLVVRGMIYARIESPKTAPGIPDLVVKSRLLGAKPIFVELKNTQTCRWGEIKHWEPHQRAWGKKWDPFSYVLVQTLDAYVLFSGSMDLDRCDEPTAKLNCLYWGEDLTAVAAILDNLSVMIGE